MCLQKFKRCLRAALARSRILSLPGGYVKHTSFEFAIFLIWNFPHQLCKFEKLFANPLRKFAMFLSAVAIFQYKKLHFKFS
jgi:hypothetical protein